MKSYEFINCLFQSLFTTGDLIIINNYNDNMLHVLICKFIKKYKIEELNRYQFNENGYSPFSDELDDDLTVLRMSRVFEKVSYKLFVHYDKSYKKYLKIIDLNYPGLLKDFKDYYKTEIKELKELYPHLCLI